MNFGPVQILIIAVVILVLFGRGRISEMMGDFGKGVKSFRHGLSDDDEPKRAPARIEGPAVEARAAPETVESGTPSDKNAA